MKRAETGKYGTPRKKLPGAAFFGSQLRYHIVKDYRPEIENAGAVLDGDIDPLIGEPL